MTPRERVLAAMNGEEVYPIASDVFENGVHPELRAKLLRHFGLATDDNEGLLKALDACIRWARPLYIGPPLEELPSFTPVYPALKVVKDMWGACGECTATYHDGTHCPLRSVETVAEVDAYPWPTPDLFDYDRVGWILDPPEAYLSVAEWAKRNGDYARLAGGWSALFSRAMDLFGMEVGLMNIAENPAVMEATIAHIGEFHEEFYRRFARACRGHFDILAWGDDFASQQGLLMQPALWRKWFLPIWKRLFAIAHENEMKSALHACGSVRAILGDLVDAGLDILEIVQVTAVGMDPKELKQEFGKHLTFYGGMDVQHILPQGSPEDVRREARRLIDILGKDGRYIFTTMHYLMDDVPLENALAMHEEVRAYRR